MVDGLHYVQRDGDATIKLSLVDARTQFEGVTRRHDSRRESVGIGCFGHVVEAIAPCRSLESDVVERVGQAVTHARG